MNQLAAHHFVIDRSPLDGTVNAGRKGLAYDWQSLSAADGVAAIEAELWELTLESAE